MKVLIIKTSSMGDLIHTLPALTDAMNAIEGIEFDWLVEENFIEIPAWHPAVKRVIPIALRRWRKNWRAAWANKEIQNFIKELKSQHYDLIIDAQGLIKSAIPAFLAKGKRVGFDRESIKEPLAALFYQQKYNITKNQQAIYKVRQLFSQALNYPLVQTAPDYGINITAEPLIEKPYLIFLHGTTWQTKFWPEVFWTELTQLANAKGYQVFYPIADQTDTERVQRIITPAETGQAMPIMTLQQIAQAIAGASAVIGVDSGLAHLTAALKIPALTLYGATNSQLTGAIGEKQKNLQSEFGCSPCLKKECSIADNQHITPPCFQMLPAQRVWETLLLHLDKI